MSSAQSTQAPMSLFPSERTSPVLVMVKNTKFWLTKNELSCFSGVFHGLFVDSPELGSSNKGTLNNPLILHGPELEQFEPLIRWIKFGSKPPAGRPFTKTDLIGMLHLAVEWDMPDAQKFCFNGLSAMVQDPFFLLRVATSYRKWDMLESLVKEAAMYRLIDWSWDEPSIYMPLMKLRIRLDEVRRFVAAVPKEIPQDEDCVNHAVFHPTHSLPLKKCFAVMTEKSPHPSKCRIAALSEMHWGDAYTLRMISSMTLSMQSSSTIRVKH
ncbi:hypothetical protein BJ165DRAFT_1533462 [Panaeolus papilionaceus]|nr:hypothetical protein BJ165DRAFT_1533462 [Panaeolus papilionaceus]